MKISQLNEIVSLYECGQCRQMVEQIDQYGVDEFWADLRYELATTEADKTLFMDMVVIYHNIKAR